MNVLISGIGGLIGSALAESLRASGHRVVGLSRSPPAAGCEVVSWNPLQGKLDPSALEGFDAVVHLAGENIASRRWSDAQKRRIRESRLQSTRLLVERLIRVRTPPRVLLSASAIGYYGNRGNLELTEADDAGSGFLADVCRDWEAETAPAAQAGLRVVNARIGVVLAARGGALAKMLLPFRLGIGGILGNGRQFMSWIAIDDVVAAIVHALTIASLSGPVNLTAPRPATNRQFTKALGRVLSRPTLFPVPAFAARLAFGEMADDLLLASICVLPTKLIESGFVFRFPDLEAALRHVLNAG